MKSWTCEALSQILVDHSRAHRAPVPIASPCLAGPSEVDERVCVFLLFSSHPHSYKCIESNPLFN
jgi:hypothetical protein